MQHTRSNAGMGVLEIVIAVAITSLLLATLFQGVILTSRLVQRSFTEERAIYLAEEAMEAVRALRTKGWSTDIANKTTGTTYYLTEAGNQWALTTTNPGTIDTLYTRTIVFAAVNRNSSDNISTTGTNDPDTRKVTVTVTWMERNQQRQVTIQTYITNYLNT